MNSNIVPILNKPKNCKTTVLQIMVTKPNLNFQDYYIKLSCNLAKNGFNTYVTTPYIPYYLTELYRFGARHIKIKSSNSGIMSIINNWFTIRKILKLYELQLINSFDIYSALMIFKLNKKPHIKHSLTLFENIPYWLRKISIPMLREVSQIFVLNSQIEENLLEILPSLKTKISRLNYSINCSNFMYTNVSQSRMSKLIANLNLPTEKSVIFIPISPTAGTNMKDLFIALSCLERKGFAAIILGNFNKKINLYRDLQSIIKEYNLENNVIILPAVDDLAALYALSDIVITSFLEEKEAIFTILEAGCMGKPIIGNSQLLKEKELIFNWDKTANKLEEILEYLLNLKNKERALLGKQSTKYMTNNHSLETLIEHSVKKLSKLLTI